MIEGTIATNEMITMLETTGTPVHYGFLDMIISGGVKPPFLAVAPIEDSEDTASDGKSGSIERSVVVVGVISRTKGDAETPMVALDTLLKETRVSLSFDPYNPPSGVNHIVDFNIGSTRFKLPEAGDEYIYFELDLIFNYIEQRI